MARTAWTLTDSSTGSPVVYSFEINPNDFTPPGRTANFKEEQVTAPNGNTILFQGRDSVKTGTMSGAVLTQQQYSDIQTWGNKWVPLTLTDDLGNSWDIVIRSLKWKRLKRANNPYRHDYTIEFTVL